MMLEKLIDQNKPIIILDGESSIEHDDVNLIHWSSSKINKKEVSIPLLVDQYGSELKCMYIELISTLGESKIEGASLKDALKNEEGFSFWWMTLLSEKSPWKSPNIFNVFKILVLKELLDSYEGKLITIKSDDQKLIKWVIAEKKESLTKVEVIRSEKRKFTSRSLLPQAVFALLYLARTIIRFKEAFFSNKISMPSTPHKNKINTVFSYSANLNFDEFSKGRIESGYWGPLNELLISCGHSLQWLMIYIPTKEFPTFSSVISKRNECFNDGNKNNSVMFLEEFLSVKLIIKSVILYYKIGKASAPYRNIITDNSNPLCFLYDDWNDSFKGRSAIDSCMKYSLLEAAINELPERNIDDSGIYVFENQAWERALAFLWKKKFKQRLIGFQHVSGKFYDLRPFDAYGANATYSDAPLPDFVAVTGEAARNDMLSFGYPENRVVIVESLRNLYLKDITKSSFRMNFNTLLVVTDYQQSATEQQIKLMSESWGIIKKNFEKVIIKPHPACRIEPILQEFNLDNEVLIRIENRSLNLLWEESDMVYTSNVTGAALESAFMGLPTLVHLGSDTFNMSPLRGVDGVKFVTRLTEFEDAINNVSVPNISDKFLCLDKRLLNWTNLLQISNND